jgi:hypothetical protein
MLLWLQITPKNIETNEQEQEQEQEQEEKWFLEPPFAVKKNNNNVSYLTCTVESYEKSKIMCLNILSMYWPGDKRETKWPGHERTREQNDQGQNDRVWKDRTPKVGTPSRPFVRGPCTIRHCDTSAMTPLPWHQTSSNSFDYQMTAEGKPTCHFFWGNLKLFFIALHLVATGFWTI